MRVGWRAAGRGVLDVLELFCGVVHMVGGEAGLLDEVVLPEAVLADNLACGLAPVFGEHDILLFASEEPLACSGGQGGFNAARGEEQVQTGDADLGLPRFSGSVYGGEDIVDRDAAGEAAAAHDPREDPVAG